MTVSGFPTFKWDGNSIASSISATWDIEHVEIEPATAEPSWNHQEVLDVWRLRGDTHIKQRAGELVIVADVSGVTGTPVARKLYDAWEELASFFSPLDGIVKLEATRTDGSGTSVVRYLLVQAMESPTFNFRQDKPKGRNAAGAYPEANIPHIVFPVRFVTACPFWITETLWTKDTGAADAELAVSGSADTVTIDNPGDRWAGVKLEYTKTTDGVTGVTIDNQTNSDQLVITKGSNFATGDYIGWLEDYERVATGDPVDLNNLVYDGGGRLRIEPGENTLQVTRDAGSGTGTFAVTWPSLHLTF